MKPTKSGTDNKNYPRVRINTELTGEPAQWFRAWKAAGLIRSAPDAVLQAFQAFHEKLTELQLKEAQLRTVREASEQ